MKALALGALAVAVAANSGVEDIKVALLSVAVVLIPTVGWMIREAIQLQTARLISARQNIESERQASEALPEEDKT
jgi:hypothetical protein